MVQLLWKTVWQFLKQNKTKQNKKELPYDPAISNSISGYVLSRIENKDSDICTLMFITALFTIAKRYKQLKCLFDEWINKMWSIHAMEYIRP